MPAHKALHADRGKVERRDGQLGVPDEAECAAVGGSFTAEACAADTACPTPCSSDVDNDGDIDIHDLLTILSDWGACP